MNDAAHDGPRPGDGSGMLRGRAVPLVKGQRIAGRYRLDGLLGRGGMGEVWAATHLVTERRVAMKFVETSLRLTDRLRERLFREARAAGRVKHPGVIEIVDAFTTEDDIPVLVMEMLEGEPLSRRLRREGALPLGEAADILLQVVSAVGAAHERGIVHRDLKPDNVFLCLDADAEPRVKVLDFGVAKLAAPGEHQSSGLTSVGQVLGTPAYMAPEQCRGDRSLDHRVDIWAIGVMTYELLSGERPVEGESVGEVVEWLLTEGVPPLRELAPEAPFDLAVMARRMLERAPGARPEDLREVADVLRKHTDRDVPDFGPAGSSVPSEDPESQHPAPAAEPAERTLAPSQHTPSPTLGDERPRRPWLLAAAVLIGAGVIGVALSGEGTSGSEASSPSASEPAATAAAAPREPEPDTKPETELENEPEPEPPSMETAAAPSITASSSAAAKPPAPRPRPKVQVAPKPKPTAAPVAAPPPAPKGPKVQGWD